MPASGTSVASRAAPPRRFENYILTRVVDPTAGLTNIKDSAFINVPGVGPDAAGSQDVVSNVVNIGFDFQLDGVVYKQFVVSMHGWMGLVDPVLGSWNLSDAIPVGDTWLNTRINLAGFSTNQVLLAPWFDDSRALAAVPTSLPFINSSYGATKIARIAAGFEPKPNLVNSIAYGVTYHHDRRHPKGRRLIVRWSIVSNYYNAAASSVLRFEVVIYENGTIQYRYSPRASILAPTFAYPAPKGTPPVYSGYEGATVGIFMPGGPNRFRDFAVGLGYREGSRQEYIYGGFVYNSGYTDTDASGNPTYTGGGEDFGHTTSYTVNLLPGYHWPGLSTAGSIFTFSPPVNRRKVLPRLAVRSQDAKLMLPLVARTGDSRLGTYLSSYDDRKSPLYGVVPTTLTGSGVPGANLDGLEWLLPRLSDASTVAYNCPASTTVTTKLTGDTNTVYNVTLRFRGIFEMKTYSGGTPAGSFFQIGGTPASDPWNVYELVISSPYQTYFLNRGTSGVYTIQSADYTETIPIAGGATVTLNAYSGWPAPGDSQELANN